MAKMAEQGHVGGQDGGRREVRSDSRGKIEGRAARKASRSQVHNRGRVERNAG